MCDYSSINEIVLNTASLFTKNKVGLTVEEIEIIKIARISILEYRNKFWIRKDTRDGFELPKCAPDSAQASDLVGIYLLYKLYEGMTEIGDDLYRDGALF